MKKQNGLALLEVVIFLILISLGYIGWMNVRKNISEYDYAMQVARSLCFYKKAFGVYLQNKSEAGAVGGAVLSVWKKVDLKTIIKTDKADDRAWLKSYGYEYEFYENNKKGYIVLKRKNNNDVFSSRDYITRTVINAAAGFLSVSLFPFNGNPDEKTIVFGKEKNIHGAGDYYTLNTVTLNYIKSDVIAIVMVPDTITPFQECYYGF